MSGCRAAAIALALVVDLADRLDAAGVIADRAPTLDEGLDAGEAPGEAAGEAGDDRREGRRLCRPSP